jgi:phage gp36-like protein
MSNYVTNQEIREQAGFQCKERGESIGTGDGSNTIFYLDHYPIVDKDYNGSVSTPEVTVYANGTVVAVSVVVASDGKVTLVSAPATSTPVTADYDWSPIDEDTIQNYADEAHAYVLSKVGQVYSLPLTSTPKTLKLIEKRLAAGYLLDKEYSVGEEKGEDTRGKRWIKWAEDKLDQIATGELELVDDSGDLLEEVEDGGIEGWPNEDTDDTDEDEGGDDGSTFKIMDKF